MSEEKVIKIDEFNSSLKKIRQQNFDTAKNNYVKSYVEMKVAQAIRKHTSTLCNEFQERFEKEIKAKIKNPTSPFYLNHSSDEVSNEYIEAISLEMMEKEGERSALMLNNFIIANKIEDIKIDHHTNNKDILSKIIAEGIEALWGRKLENEDE